MDFPFYGVLWRFHTAKKLIWALKCSTVTEVLVEENSNDHAKQITSSKHTHTHAH